MLGPVASLSEAMKQHGKAESLTDQMKAAVKSITFIVKMILSTENRNGHDNICNPKKPRRHTENIADL